MYMHGVTEQLKNTEIPKSIVYFYFVSKIYCNLHRIKYYEFVCICFLLKVLVVNLCYKQIRAQGNFFKDL